MMKSLAAVFLLVIAATSSAQQPSSAFDRGHSLQAFQDPELATILFDKTNTGGAVSRSKNGALFLAVRGIGGGVEQLEPRRRMFANTFKDEPLECAGGTVNDLVADARSELPGPDDS